MKLTFNPIDVFMLTQLEDVDLTETQPINKTHMKTITITMTDDDAETLLENLKLDEENGVLRDAFNVQVTDTDNQ